MECAYCKYKDTKEWEKKYIRMTVESVEIFYICPNCGVLG
jgi:hypothetical protein